jgi:transposase
MKQQFFTKTQNLKKLKNSCNSELECYISSKIVEKNFQFLNKIYVRVYCTAVGVDFEKNFISKLYHFSIL